MDWRLRLPSALYRLAVARAGSDHALADVVRAYLTRYTAGQSEAQAYGAEGGQRSAAQLTPEERRERARKAVQARWARRSRSTARDLRSTSTEDEA